MNTIGQRVRELSRRMAHRRSHGPVSGECAWDCFVAIVGDEEAQRFVAEWGGEPLSVQFSQAGFVPIWSVEQ
jgi:hypothetical protein